MGKETREGWTFLKFKIGSKSGELDDLYRSKGEGGKRQVSYGEENEMIIILSPKKRKESPVSNDLKESFLLSLLL